MNNKPTHMHKLVVGTDEEKIAHVMTMLGEHFKVDKLEKYDQAIIRMLFNEGLEKFHKGRNTRVGEHLLTKIHKYMSVEFKKRYGPFLSVLRRKDRFFSNFHMVFKTDKGRLYQSNTFPDLFFTSHTLERYEERMPDLETFEYTSGVNSLFRQRWGVSPTAYDSLDMILEVISEYGVPVEGDLLILNLTFGFLVLDVFEHFSIAKTFLSPDMNLPRCEWFSREGPIEKLDSTVLEDSTPIAYPKQFMCKNGRWETNIPELESEFNKLG